MVRDLPPSTPARRRPQPALSPVRWALAATILILAAFAVTVVISLWLVCAIACWAFFGHRYGHRYARRRGPGPGGEGAHSYRQAQPGRGFWV